MTDSPIPDFPDTERCIAELLRPLVREADHIGNFVVEDFDTQVLGWSDDGQHTTDLLGLGDDGLFITVTERGGPVDLATFTAYPILEVSCWGKSRSVARNGAARVLRLLVLDNLDGQFMAGGHLFDSAEDISGQEEVTVTNPDDRCVSQTFQLECRPMFD